MPLVNWLLVASASLGVVLAVDIALTPCYSVFYLKNATQEFKFDSKVNAAGANLSDCVFTLQGPTNASLKLFFHDVVEKDPMTGESMIEALCIDGAVRIYEMTSDGDLYVSDAVCRSLSNSTEVNTTHNIAIITSTITSGTFNLSVTVVPGPIPTAPKDVEVDKPAADEPLDEVFEDPITTNTTAMPITDEDNALTEVDVETMMGNISNSENEVINNDTVMAEEVMEMELTPEVGKVTEVVEETKMTTVINNKEMGIVDDNKTPTERQPVMSEDSITVEAAEMTETENNSIMEVKRVRNV